jgi:ribosome-binding factor A
VVNNRLQRVEQTLRREIAAALVQGEVHDPRVAAHVAAISVTGVKVAADLGSARVFVDVLSQDVDLKSVLKGLNAAAATVRSIVGRRIRMKRTPSLRFERDESIGRGAAVEQVLAELAKERKDAEQTSEDAGDDGESSEAPEDDTSDRA